MENPEKIKEAAAVIAENPTGGMAFTGAGISVESGIPPFRGSDGLWSKVDPSFIEINQFLAAPEESWKKIRELFYDHWGQAKPNDAHYRVAEMVAKGYLKGIVTQNIDCLHQRAGAPEDKIYEFHGTLDALVCMKCSASYRPDRSLLDQNRPSCPKCGGLLKPDFVFFSEGIPEKAFTNSFRLAEECAWCLIIGTSGEVMPACDVPRSAKRHGAKIIEISTEQTAFTRSITDIFLCGKATEIMNALAQELKLS
ncbi:MAG: RNA polymerase subunit sigma [Lentisphaerae bacterium]|nr:RNA polymerase subunit sigma [Lentisphaerota bacterium]